MGAYADLIDWRASAHLEFDPRVGVFEAGAQRRGRLPMQLLFDKAIIRIPAADAEGSRNVGLVDDLAGNVRDHVNQLVDRHHFLRANVDWPFEILRTRESDHSLEAFINVQERTRLIAVAPYFYFSVVFR